MAGHDYATVEVSDRTFHGVYLAPFRAAVDAGVACIMPAFTDLSGVPMHANAAVAQGVLRSKWGFKGVVVSDYTGIDELGAHGVAEDLAPGGRPGAQGGDRHRPNGQGVSGWPAGCSGVGPGRGS